ncbi:MAG: NAD(P)H-hydrate dehydratase [Methylophilus sp.]|nr:NAD(P)H-hydrate dehydratase [Methylophilus sp.]
MQHLFINPDLLDLATVRNLLLHRPDNAHKGTFGKAVLVGGDDGMQGALLLAARSALHSGVGRVYAISLANQPVTLDVNFPEIMFRPLNQPQTWLTLADHIVIGTGLGQTAKSMDVLALCLQQNKSLLLDADALNLIAKHPRLAELMRNRTSPSVMTPHPAEAARLMDASVEDVQSYRAECAREIANQFHTICVLKGAGTIIAGLDDVLLMNPTGNVGLATAGTGDVLSGLIGGFMTQGMTALDAAQVGVYVHGLAADRLVEAGIGPIGLTASEIITSARQTLNHMYAKRDSQLTNEAAFITV